MSTCQIIYNMRSLYGQFLMSCLSSFHFSRWMSRIKSKFSLNKGKTRRYFFQVTTNKWSCCSNVDFETYYYCKSDCNYDSSQPFCLPPVIDDVSEPQCIDKKNKKQCKRRKKFGKCKKKKFWKRCKKTCGKCT